MWSVFYTHIHTRICGLIDSTIVDQPIKFCFCRPAIPAGPSDPALPCPLIRHPPSSPVPGCSGHTGEGTRHHWVRLTRAPASNTAASSDTVDTEEARGTRSKKDVMGCSAKVGAGMLSPEKHLLKEIHFDSRFSMRQKWEDSSNHSMGTLNCPGWGFGDK